MRNPSEPRNVYATTKVISTCFLRLSRCHCHKLELTTSTSQNRYMAEKKAITNAALLSVNITVDLRG
ncbi:hypothetical protein KIN20_008285 [Parelaphostrongylus tenuis]|uniref:Uncharacterized protein n=1 Tax=Parelaphostrongylus tenuis TaxID=148309 RepID=A0AAD5QIT5_PARTN|nr:hypothetical protein KIN20_008285 [Parelaphostrongylus tenuis]